MSAGNFDWLFKLGGSAIGLCGLLLLAWALFKDRSRGRRRCPKCWYDMSGSAGLACPECGHVCQSERRLLKTRRHWKRAAVGVLVLVAAACLAAFPTYRLGWTRLVPTLMLSAFAPAEDPSTTQASFALAALRGNSVVIVNGNPIAVPAAPPAPPGAPPTPIAQQLTDEFWLRLDSRKVSRWNVERFFQRYFRNYPVDLSQAVVAPDRWPANSPIKVQVRMPPMAKWNGRDLDLYARRQGTREQVLMRGNLAAVSADSEEIGVEVWLQYVNAVLHSEVISVPISIRGTVGTFLDRLDDAGTNKLVRAALNPRLRWDGWSPVLMISDRSNSAAWNRIKFGVAFRAELVAGEEVLATGAGKADWNRPVWKDWDEIPLVWTAGGWEKAAGAKGLRVVLRGDTETVGRMYMDSPWGKEAACWGGRVEFEAPERDEGTRP